MNISDGQVRLSDTMATLDKRSGGSGVGAQTSGVALQQANVMAIPLQEVGKRRSFAIGSHAGCADGDQTNRSHDSGGPVGMGISEELSHSLRAGRTQAVASVLAVMAVNISNGSHYVGQVCAVVAPVVGVDIAPTLAGRDAKGPRNFQDGALQATVFPTGRPRRLTPLEAERLMSWPDQWTAEGVREDGLTYALSDTARYRLCGNGVGSVVAQWIGQRLLWAETSTPSTEPSHA